MTKIDSPLKGFLGRVIHSVSPHDRGSLIEASVNLPIIGFFDEIAGKPRYK